MREVREQENLFVNCFMMELKGGGPPPTQYPVLLEGGGPLPTQYPVLLDGWGPLPTQYLREGAHHPNSTCIRNEWAAGICFIPSGCQ